MRCLMTSKLLLESMHGEKSSERIEIMPEIHEFGGCNLNGKGKPGKPKSFVRIVENNQQNFRSRNIFLDAKCLRVLMRKVGGSLQIKKHSLNAQNEPRNFLNISKLPLIIVSYILTIVRA